MPRFKIVAFLTCMLLTVAASSAVAKNDLEIFGLPAQEFGSQEKSGFEGQFNLVLDTFTSPDSAAHTRRKPARERRGLGWGDI